MNRYAFVALLILCLGQACCTNRQADSDATGRPQEGLSAELLQQIQAKQRGRYPWQNASPDIVALRRQVFDLRHRLIAAGQDVKTDMGRQAWVLEDLALDVQTPAKHVCGQDLTIKITLHNRSQRPMRLLTWHEAFNVNLLHESGHIVRQPPPVRAAEASAIIPPRPEEYRTLAPNERFVHELKLQYLPSNLPPGLYHVEVTYYTGAWGNQKDTVEGAAGSLVKEVRFVLGREAAGLRASLQLDKPNDVDPDTTPVFLAKLENTTDREIMIMPWAGALIFRDVQTGKEIEFNHTIADPEDVPPRHPRGYPIRSSYRTLRPGEAVTLWLRPQGFFDGKRYRDWREMLTPGRAYEVGWHYYNDWGWFIEDGGLGQFGNVWTGQLGSDPVTFTMPPSAHPAAPAEPSEN